MSILFSVIAKGVCVIAQSACYDGNFAQVTAELLSKIPPHDDKFTFANGNYLFHYAVQNTMVYFCITHDTFLQCKAFSFLHEVQKKVQIIAGGTPVAHIPPLVLKHAHGVEFARVLKTEMNKFNGSKTSLTQVKEQLQELKSIMVKNVEKVSERGERLENLMARTHGLSVTSHAYRATSVRVQRKYWWQNLKMHVLLVLVLVAVAYFISVAACGGFTWRNCVS